MKPGELLNAILFWCGPYYAGVALVQHNYPLAFVCMALAVLGYIRHNEKRAARN